jgi:hypothetical protein
MIVNVVGKDTQGTLVVTTTVIGSVTVIVSMFARVKIESAG